MPVSTFAVGRCNLCGQRSEITVESGLANRINIWRFDSNPNKPFVQTAFPELSADIREQLLTGTHGECWINLFGKEE